MKDKIAFDASMAIGQYRGMGASTRLFMSEVDSIALSPTNTSDFANVVHPKSGFLRHQATFPLWEQFYLYRLCKKLDVNILVCPYNTGPIFLSKSIFLVLIVNDLIFMEPLERIGFSHSLYQNAGRLYRRCIFPRSLKRADLVICPSNSTKTAILEKYDLAHDNLFVVPSAHKEILTDDCATDKHNGTTPFPSFEQPYILMVGGETPTKNVSRGMKAYGRLRALHPNLDHHLVIAGISSSRRDKFMHKAKALGIEQCTHILPYISRSDMSHMYQQASLLFMPSLLEGFGIPLLEAMSSGTPIVCSQNSSLPEVCGAAALYIDPYSIDSMGEGLAKLINDTNLQQELRAAAQNELKRYEKEVVLNQVRSVWSQIRSLAKASR